MIDILIQQQIKERIQRELIEEYVRCNLEHSSDLTFQEKEKIVSNRIKHLKQTNWQRWVPFLGYYSNLKDIRNDDTFILTNFMPESYHFSNVVYNQIAPAIIIDIVYNFLK